MRLNHSRRTTLSTAVALALGVTIAGGMTTAAHAAEVPQATARVAVAHVAPADEAIAPFVSAEAAALSTEPLDDIVDDAEAALDEAEAAIAAAEAAETKVAKKVKSSKLDIAGATTVDTTVLEEHVEQLETIAVTPVLLLPDNTADAAADTAKVKKATVSLLDRLDKAEKKRAAEIAAKKAAAKKAAAEAAAKKAAEEAAASASSSSSGSVSGGSAASSGDNSVAGAKATARALLADRGWGSDQFSCLDKLWQKESGWNYRAYNSSSGAYGIPQALPGSKMGSAGSDWETSAATQIRWGLGYIDGRYGTPCGAWDHSQSVGWY
ncbi:lytic transglycosylase domain-containing protein [Microbacterium sp. LjRoot45]|uniref:aggregation-promoting factor C-terminal-like domain-containing protein n=1 Tax=Microbacterium sp. LjRoot45 TaxID=3342329 RepID=UPI003ED153D0